MRILKKNAIELFYGGDYVERILNGRLTVLILVGLVTCFWWPALWDGKTLLHADSAHHGLSLLSYLTRALSGDESMLWSSRIYGGHPLFAEGQGGFANPFNILCAYLFEPVYGIGVLHWLSALVGGLGVYKLCRTLDIGRWSATFGSIAATFSSSWIYFQYNMTVSATLAWVPWLLLAAEYWFKKPSCYRAVLLAIPAALLVFSGYPLITQGAALFVAFSFFVEPAYKRGRVFIRNNLKLILFTGGFAVVMAVALSAVQFLPLLELVEHSYRGEGIEILLRLKASEYFAGLLYFNFDSLSGHDYAPLLGNMVVVFIVFLLPFFKVNQRITGYAFATFMLFNLGMEYSSPLFRFIYHHDLIPGLKYHRLVSLFLPIAVVGLAVIAAYVLDRMSKEGFSQREAVFSAWCVTLVSKCLALSLICIFIVFSVILYNESVSLVSIVAPVVFFVFFVILYCAKKKAWIPVVAVFVLVIDVLMLRVGVFNFYEHSIEVPPNTMQKILADAELQSYKTHDSSGMAEVAFLPSNAPGLDLAYLRWVKSLNPFPGLEWGVPSIDGVLALRLKGRLIMDSALQEEKNTDFATEQKTRLMDIWGIRYISARAPMQLPGISLIVNDVDGGVFIYKNERAKPKFQLYDEVVWVETPQDAVKGLHSTKKNILFVERAKGSEESVISLCYDCTTEEKTAPKIEVVESGSVKYRVNVELDHDAWLFLADANYPGWQATVNGQQRNIYTAQVFGKAIRLDAGRNDVEIKFSPNIFYWGAVISLLAWLFSFGVIISHLIKNRLNK